MKSRYNKHCVEGITTTVNHYTPTVQVLPVKAHLFIAKIVKGNSNALCV